MYQTHQCEPPEVVLTNMVGTSHATMGIWHLLMEAWGWVQPHARVEMTSLTVAIVVPVEDT